MASTAIVLPDNVLLKIISQIPISQWASLEGVDKAFRRNVWSKWQELEILRFDEDLAIDRQKLMANPARMMAFLMLKLIRRAPNIKTMSGFSIFTDDIDWLIVNEKRGETFIEDGFLNLLSRFNKLENIDLRNVPTTYEGLIKLLTTPEIRGRLKKLKVFNSLIAMSTIADNILFDQILKGAFGEVLSQPSLQLQEFCFGGGGTGFTFFDTMDATNLTALKIIQARCTPDEIIWLLQRCHGRLEHLECNLYWVGLTDTFLDCQMKYLRQQIDEIAKCGNLSILKLSNKDDCVRRDGANLTNKLRPQIVDWIRKLGRAGRLLELSLLDSEFIDDRVITSISTHLSSNLIALEVHVDNCTTATLINLIEKSGQLKKFGLYTNPDDQHRLIDNDLIKSITLNMENLEELHLTDPAAYPKMKNDLIRLNKMKSLSFQNSKSSNNQLSIWIDVFGSKLESLELKNYLQPQFESKFQSLIKKTPNLRRLSLEKCKIPDVALWEIAMRCPNLEEFNFKKSASLKGISGLQAIIDGCKNLKRLFGLDKKTYENLKFGKYRRVPLNDLEAE